MIHRVPLATLLLLAILAAWFADSGPAFAQSVSSVSVGSITRTTAVVTLDIVNSGGSQATFYVRHRTPARSGAWSSTASVSTSGTSTPLTLTGLSAGSEYRVQASASSSFPAGSTVETDFTTREEGLLVFDVGNSSGLYGYRDGAFGSLVYGDFPGDLFGDGNDRTVEEIYEDADGYWFLVYSGGTTQDWNDDDEDLIEIQVKVIYEDGRDERAFVLAGFIEAREGNYTLKLDPPLPRERDWDTRDGEEVAMEFRQHRTQALATTTPSILTEPAGSAGSFVEFLSESTPGGPVMAQTLMVILVYVMFLYQAPATPWGILLTSVVLVMTPWVPVLFGYGSTIAAGIILVNVLAGAYSYKVFAARTES